MGGKKNSPVVVHRPKEVEYAIKLLLTSLVVTVLVSYFNYSVTTQTEYFQVYAYFILLGLLFNGYFIYKISQNRNWARKFYIGFTLLSLIMYVPQIVTGFATAPFNAILQLLNILIQAAAIYFLLTKEAKKWFLLVNNKKKA